MIGATRSPFGRLYPVDTVDTDFCVPGRRHGPPAEDAARAVTALYQANGKSALIAVISHGKATTLRLPKGFVQVIGGVIAW